MLEVYDDSHFLTRCIILTSSQEEERRRELERKEWEAREAAKRGREAQGGEESKPSGKTSGKDTPDVNASHQCFVSPGLNLIVTSSGIRPWLACWGRTPQSVLGGLG